MYTTGTNKPLNIKQQFGCRIWNGLPKPQQWNTMNQKGKQDKPQFMMVKFQNVIIPMHRTRFDTCHICHQVCHVMSPSSLYMN